MSSKESSAVFKFIKINGLLFCDEKMKWVVLSDNRSCDTRLYTEHGLSVLLETENHKILLDTGATGLFLHNAKVLGIDLSDVDFVFISHGHNDHAGGLSHFLEHNQQAKVIVSPHAMSGRFFSRRNHLHSITANWPYVAPQRLVLVDNNLEIERGLHVIADIPVTYPIPKGNGHLYVQLADDRDMHDNFCHEIALYLDGLLFTGCAHRGLENILAASPGPIHFVVGGFHLLDGLESEEELISLANRLTITYPQTQFFTGHCTGDKVFEVMKSMMGNHLHPFSCGTEINIK